MSTSNDEEFNRAIPILKAAFDMGTAQGYAKGHTVGFAEGLQAGKALGLIEGINTMTPAVSDGLRYGSPVCGQAMQSLKRLGLDTGDESDDDNQEDDGAEIDE